MDFADLYAPTVATSSVRLLAAFANEYDLELCHYDVDQAFVRADLKEDVFMSCLLYTSPSPRDGLLSRMPSSA